MSEIKFACPTCQQHIEADSGYAGMHISCPACKNPMMVPGTPAVAAAPAPVPIPACGSAPAPTPVSAPSRSTAAVAAPPVAGCPSCGGVLPRGAVLCTQCGYNLATGERKVAGRKAALGKPANQNWESPWYMTAYPYLAVVLVVLSVLYYFGRTNPPLMLAFLGVAVLYCLTVHILVVISAFRESVGTGFLTLCVPFYGLYYVFKVSESETLRILYATAYLLNLALRFLSIR